MFTRSRNLLIEFFTKMYKLFWFKTGAFMSENRFLEKHFIVLWMLIASIADDRGGISFASNHLVFKK